MEKSKLFTLVEKNYFRKGDRATLNVCRGSSLEPLDARTLTWRPNDLSVTTAVAIYLPVPGKSNVAQKPPPQSERDIDARIVEGLAYETPHMILARRLIEDPASPWCGKVQRKRTTTSGLRRRVSLPMLETAIRRFLRDADGATPNDIHSFYKLLLTFWQAVRAVFPNDWDNDRHSLLVKGIGLQAFTKLLTDFFAETPFDQLTESYFLTRLSKLANHIDWGNDGPFARMRGVAAYALKANKSNIIQMG